MTHTATGTSVRFTIHSAGVSHEVSATAITADTTTAVTYPKKASLRCDGAVLRSEVVVIQTLPTSSPIDFTNDVFAAAALFESGTVGRLQEPPVLSNDCQSPKVTVKRRQIAIEAYITLSAESILKLHESPRSPVSPFFPVTL